MTNTMGHSQGGYARGCQGGSGTSHEWRINGSAGYTNRIENTMTDKTINKCNYDNNGDK